MSRHHTTRMNPGSNRSIRLLGLNVNDIAVSLFSNKEAPHTAGGKIARSEFFGFWTQLSPEEAEQYLAAVITQMIACIEKKGQLPHTNITFHSLVNTASFLLMSNSIYFNPHKLAQIYATNFDQRPDLVVKYAQDSLPLRNFIRIFHARVNGERNHEFLAPLIVGASTFQPGTRLGEVMRIPTIDESDILSNENGFIYPYLCELVEERGVDVQTALLHHIFDKILSLSQVARMNFAAAEPSFLSLTFMLRNFLQFDAVSAPQFIERGITVLQPLFLWPKPYSTLALQTIRLLQAELISPGFSRRQALIRESRFIDYHLQQNANPDSNVGFYRYTKPIFYLFDSEDPASTPLLHILDTVPSATSSMVNFRFNETSAQDKRFEQNDILLPHGTLALMLLHALHVNISLEQSDIDMISRLYPSQIVSLLKKLDAPVHEFFTLQEQKKTPPPFDRNQHLESIHKEMIEMANANTDVTSPLFTYNIPTQRIRGDEVVPVTTPFLPFFPNVEHIRMPLLLRTRGTEHEKQGKYFPAAFVVEKIHSMITFLRDHIGSNESQYEREIRFVVVGGDTLLQHVVTTHYLLQTNHQEDIQGIQIKWYLAPTTRNHLAYYIARYDLWYQRHVFNPLRSASLVVPWMKDGELDLKQGIITQDAAISQPTQYLRSLMANYIHTAHNSLNVTIYVLEGRIDANNHEPDETIPFVQRVEVGLRPAAEEFRLSKGLRIPIEEVYRDKTFTFQSLDLNASYTKMDLMGNPRPDTNEESVPFNSILLSNVPRKNDPCNPPDPTGLGLELFFKLDRGKVKKTVMDPRPHVLSVSLTSPTGTKFKVLVDGVLHGPYASIKVRVGNFNTNNPLQPPITAKFPVQTFFPIQLQSNDHTDRY